MKPKKVLIISYNFIPNYWSLGGVIRVVSLAEYLMSNNYEVHILTASGKFYSFFGYESLANRINIDYVGSKRNSSKPKPTYKLIVAIGKLLRKISSQLLIPDRHLIEHYHFYRKAKAIIDTNNIYNIIVTSPPHSIQLVGNKLKNYYKEDINYIIDYRDSWNATPIFRPKVLLAKNVSIYLERQALARCDSFCYVSAPILKKVEKLCDLNISSKSKLIMNGYTKMSERNLGSKSNPPIKIGYFGALNDNLHSFRNISPLLDVMHDSFFKSNIELHFYGHTRLKKYDNSDKKSIFLHGSVSHKAAIEEMHRMDFLLLVHTDTTSSDEVITGKFFEYISVKRPILALASKNMEAAKLIEKYKIGYVMDYQDPNDIKNKLKMVLQNSSFNFYKNKDFSIFKREEQYKKFLKIIK
jgi:hypothetical protein